MAPLTDQEMDLEIGRMLQFGVALSAIVVFVGGLLYLRHAGSAVLNYTHFHATPQALRKVPGVFHGVRAFEAESVIQLGILLLIATPVVRVIYCVVGFARQRDRLYVGISALVLAILIYSLTEGGR